MEAVNHPDIVGISIATRPDCLPDEVIDLLEEINRIKPVWVELGLQTIHAKSAEYIRRGYELPVYEAEYSGFVNGENEDVITTKPTVITTATKTSNVGDYALTASGGVASNYELVYEPGVLTITKAPLSAKVNDATKVYGSSNPACQAVPPPPRKQAFGQPHTQKSPSSTILSRRGWPSPPSHAIACCLRSQCAKACRSLWGESNCRP